MTREESKLKLKEDWNRLSATELKERLDQHFRSFIVPEIREKKNVADEKSKKKAVEIFDGNIE